jgi:hypothetical protein
MAKNKRIYYAIQQAGLKALNSDSYTAIHGVQNVGMTTNFNLSQVFELGIQSIYYNVEEIPDVQVTLSKVLDGYPLMYHLATKGTATTDPSLAGRANTKTFFGMSIFSDSLSSAVGTPPSIVECSGMFVSSVSYSFPKDGNFTEDVTLVGNDKIWLGDVAIVNTADAARRDALSFNGDATFADNDDAPLATTGVQRRQNLIFGTGSAADVSVFPLEVYGITSSGTNELDADGDYGVHINSVTVSVDLGRESITELGRRGPYHRTVTFPVQVTCEVEVTSISGDMISATEAGILNTTGGNCTDGGNLTEGTIRLATCEGTRIFLGDKNMLQSVNYGGGNAGGGNATVTYSFVTYNDFTVVHSGDPHASGSAWWTARSTYLT